MGHSSVLTGKSEWPHEVKPSPTSQSLNREAFGGLEEHQSGSCLPGSDLLQAPSEMLGDIVALLYTRPPS